MIRTRRSFLRRSLGAAPALLLGSGRWSLLSQATASPAVEPLAGGRLLGVVPFLREGDFPLGTMVGSGAEGFWALDLSTLGPDTMVTPNERFFIRTGYPEHASFHSSGKILVRGLVEAPVELSFDELVSRSEPMGNPPRRVLRQPPKRPLWPHQRRPVERGSRLQGCRKAYDSATGDPGAHLGFGAILPAASRLPAPDQLDLFLRAAGGNRSLLRHGNEWVAASQGPRLSDPSHRARLVRLHLHQVGGSDRARRRHRCRHPPDEGRTNQDARGPYGSPVWQSEPFRRREFRTQVGISSATYSPPASRAKLQSSLLGRA